VPRVTFFGGWCAGLPHQMVRGYDTGVDPYRTLGRALSISLAITFRTHRSDVWTDAHCFNHRLRRRLGVALVDVGSIGALDAAKASLVRMGRHARRWLQPR